MSNNGQRPPLISKNSENKGDPIAYPSNLPYEGRNVKVGKEFHFVKIYERIDSGMTSLP